MIKPVDIDPSVFVKELAARLQEYPEIKAPGWAVFVKTGRDRERPPLQRDWWHVRSAAILRTVYRLGPVGTSKLRTKYGGKKNRGVASEHAYKGSGNIIRTILQQLEKAGLVAQATKGLRKGRIMTPKGAKLLNSLAKALSGPLPKRPKAAAEPKPEPRKAEPKKAGKRKDGKRAGPDKAAEA
ncbi:30S ribosomal protein S19e [Candidatus Woesearchaeota archaeon]|nr:30S ribosomal protein S19e [Candidatus Woesearchaeota archaeon]